MISIFVLRVNLIYQNVNVILTQKEKKTMSDLAYFSSDSKDKGLPRKQLKHCIVCCKKRNLLFYCSTINFILMICNKCLDTLGEQDD